MMMGSRTLMNQLETQLKIFGVSDSWLHSIGQRTVQEVHLALLKTSLTQALQGGSIPPNVDSLHGVFLFQDKEAVLEVMEVHDIGVSTYSLLDRLQETQVSEKRRILNVTEEPTQGDEGLSYSTQKFNGGTAQGFQSSLQNSKAMLSVRVSDGWTSVKALERAPIAGLNLALDIGTKILVRNVLVRRGVLILDPSCCRVLGGSVPEWNQVPTLERLESNWRSKLGLKVSSRVDLQPNEQASNQPAITYRRPAPQSISRPIPTHQPHTTMKHEPTSLEKEGEFESPDDDELEWALLNDPSIAQAFQDPVVLDLTEISPSVSPIKRPRISDCIQDRMSPIQLSEILKDSRLSGVVYTRAHVVDHSKMALSSKTGYSMTVNIADDTGAKCSVVLSDSVIQSHIGISAKEAKGLRKTEAGASSVVQKLTDFYTKLDSWKEGLKEFKLQRQDTDDTIHWIWAP